MLHFPLDLIRWPFHEDHEVFRLEKGRNIVGSFGNGLKCMGKGRSASDAIPRGIRNRRDEAARRDSVCELKRTKRPTSNS